MRLSNRHLTTVIQTIKRSKKDAEYEAYENEVNPVFECIAFAVYRPRVQ